MPIIVLPTPREHQAEKIAHPARHKILVCGRRWGKTQMGIHCAVVGHGPNRSMRGAIDGATVWVIDQNHPSSTTLWYAIRGTLAPIAAHVSESNRRVLLPGGGSVTVKSAVSVDSLVGDVSGLDGVVMNEAAKFNPLVWQKALRPALSDKKGWSVWPSTPEGLNYFHALYENAQDPDKNGEWARWQEASTKNKYFDPNEIEAARREGLSELLCRQEFYGEFVVIGGGRAYYEFAASVHVPDPAIERDEDVGIDLCLGFSIAPAACLVTQTIIDHNGRPKSELVLDEIVAPGSDPSIRALLAEFRRRYPRHSFGERVRVFGEVAGRSTGHSDFEAMRAGLPRADFRTTVGVDEKDRTNAVNAILRDGSGRVRAAIHPQAERLLRDLQGVRNSGNSFAIESRGSLGTYAAAWGAKIRYVYPALHETVRAHREEFGSWARRPVETPEARKAHDLYWSAVRRGQIVRPDACETCGKVGPVEADHRDYSRPLEVTHCCRSCHRKLPPAGGTIQAS